MEKLLEDASIKLGVVASTITETSSRAMLGALLAGERDPEVMADLAQSQPRRKIPEPREALTGRFDDHHALIVGHLLTLDEPYHVLGPTWLDQRARSQANTRRLVTQLERLSRTVVLDPEAPPAA